MYNQNTDSAIKRRYTSLPIDYATVFFPNEVCMSTSIKFSAGLESPCFALFFLSSLLSSHSQGTRLTTGILQVIIWNMGH